MTAEAGGIESVRDAYMKSRIWEDKTWEYDTTKNVILKKGKPNSIMGFELTDIATGEDETQQVLTGKQVLVSIKHAEPLYEDDRLKTFEAFVQELSAEGVGVNILNSSSTKEIEKLKNDIAINAADFYYFDKDESKAMIRSDVGFLVIKDGVVKGKWHINDFPTVKEVLAKVE